MRSEEMVRGLDTSVHIQNRYIFDVTNPLRMSIGSQCLSDICNCEWMIGAEVGSDGVYLDGILTIVRMLGCRLSAVYHRGNYQAGSVGLQSPLTSY